MACVTSLAGDSWQAWRGMMPLCDWQGHWCDCTKHTAAICLATSCRLSQAKENASKVLLPFAAVTQQLCDLVTNVETNGMPCAGQLSSSRPLHHKRPVEQDILTGIEAAYPSITKGLSNRTPLQVSEPQETALDSSSPRPPPTSMMHLELPQGKASFRLRSPPCRQCLLK